MDELIERLESAENIDEVVEILDQPEISEGDLNEEYKRLIEHSVVENLFGTDYIAPDLIPHYNRSDDPERTYND